MEGVSFGYWEHNFFMVAVIPDKTADVHKPSVCDEYTLESMTIWSFSRKTQFQGVLEDSSNFVQYASDLFCTRVLGIVHKSLWNLSQEPLELSQWYSESLTSVFGRLTRVFRIVHKRLRNCSQVSLESSARNPCQLFASVLGNV